MEWTGYASLDEQLIFATFPRNHVCPIMLIWTANSKLLAI